MRYLISLVALMYALSASLYGQERGTANTAQQPKAPKTTTSTTTVKKSPAAAKKTPAKPASPAKTASTAATTTRTSSNTAYTPTITSTTPTNQFVRDPRLEARLLKMLPEGTNLNRAAAGFRNWGQFVATVHVSNNLDIPFRELKTRMVGNQPMSLGQAIQDWKGTNTSTATTPIINPRPASTEREVRRAEEQADEDFRRARDDQR